MPRCWRFASDSYGRVAEAELCYGPPEHRERLGGRARRADRSMRNDDATLLAVRIA